MAERVMVQGTKVKRLLIFSDPHIAVKAEFSKPTEDGLTDYLHQVQRSFAWINSLIVRLEPNAVICLGDLFETTGHVDTTSLKVATELVGYLKGVCGDYNANLVFLVGNHDTYSEEHRIHNLEFLRPVVDHVIDEPTLLWDWLYLVPWMDDTSRVKVPRAARICLTHLDVHGGWLSGKHKCDFGVDPSSFPVHTFNGHQHLPCNVTDKFTNVGSLLSRSFRDSGGHAPRGAVLAKLDQEVSFERYINPHERPFTTIEIMDEVDAELWSETPDGYESTYLRIKCSKANREVAELVGCLSAGARIEEVPEDNRFEEDSQVAEEFSPEENFRQAVEEVMLFDEDGDRERILRYGLEAIGKCKNVHGTAHAAPIEFIRLCAKNFQSLGDIELLLQNRGLIAVLGNNGVGKSSIAEAIFWILTGVSLRGYVGDDVIRWGEDSCSGWLELLINHTEYTIERTRHPNKVRLWMGDEEISCRRSADTNDKIAQLIGRSKAILQHSVFLTSDLQTKFTSLRYPDRIKLVEQITGADIYAEIFKVVDKSWHAATGEMDRITGAQVQAARTITALTERKQKASGETAEAMRAQKLGMGKLKASLAKSLDRKSVLATEIVELDKLIEDANKKRGAVVDKVKAMAKAASDAEKLLAENEIVRNQIKRQLSDALAKIQRGSCPTCGQAIAEDAPIADTAGKLREELARLAAAHGDLAGRVKRTNRDLDAANDELDEIGDPARFITAKDNKNRAMLQVEKESNNIKLEMQKQRTMLESLTAARNEITEQLDMANVALDDLAIEAEAQKREIYAWEWLVNAFSTTGIRAKLLATVTMPYLNSRIEQHSDRLGLPCKLTNKTETKGGKVEDKLDVIFAGDLTYRGCSRGQRRKVDLAIQKAFNDLATKTGGYISLLVCDEVIDPLDDASTQAFAELLREADQTVLLMTHKPFAEALADDKIQLILQDGETIIC